MIEQWMLIEADLQDCGIDVESGILRERSARWLRTRILGLLAADTRVGRHFQAKQPQPSPPEEEKPRGRNLRRAR